MTESNTAGPSRRDFIREATAAAVGTAAVARFHGLVGAHAAGTDEIRVGLVGCGGRGSGAAGNVLAAAPGVRIVALADAFQDRLTACREPACAAASGYRHRGPGPLLRRPRRVSAAAEDRRQLRDPRHAAGFPGDAHRGVDCGRQEHLRGKARGRRCRWRAVVHRAGRRGGASAASRWAPARSTDTSIRTSSR